VGQIALLAWCEGGQDLAFRCHVGANHFLDDVETLLREAHDDLAAVMGG